MKRQILNVCKMGTALPFSFRKTQDVSLTLPHQYRSQIFLFGSYQIHPLLDEDLVKKLLCLEEGLEALIDVQGTAWLGLDFAFSR